jgi:hypothetical protein
MKGMAFGRIEYVISHGTTHHSHRRQRNSALDWKVEQENVTGHQYSTTSNLTNKGERVFLICEILLVVSIDYLVASLNTHFD